MHPSVPPSTHLSLRPSVVHPLVHLYGLIPTHSSAILPICPAVCPSIRPFPPPLRPSDHQYIHPAPVTIALLLSRRTIHPSVRWPFVRLSIFRPIRPSVHPCVSPSVRPSVC